MMNFIYQIACLWVSLKNCFSSKHYQVQLIGRVILFTRRNPDIVIRDYYFYVYQLLLTNLNDVTKNCFILFGCRVFKFFGIFLPTLQIDLQIEHTLVKPGGRGTNGSSAGTLVIPKSSEQYLVRIADFSRLGKANIIFDYSRINLHNIRSNVAFQAYARKTFCISPTLYPLCISTEGREGAITLFGNPDDSRRKDFLDSLKKHRVESRNVQGVYSNLDAVYRQAKIVINIRQTEHHDTLEELRVLPALRSGAIVICESAPYAEKTWYSKFIIWGSLADLPALVADTQINYNQIHARVFGTSELNSSFLRRMNRIELCNKLVAEKATRKLSRDLAGH
jgi:hypothetical protein